MCLFKFLSGPLDDLSNSCTQEAKLVRFTFPFLWPDTLAAGAWPSLEHKCPIAFASSHHANILIRNCKSSQPKQRLRPMSTGHKASPRTCPGVSFISMYFHSWYASVAMISWCSCRVQASPGASLCEISPLAPHEQYTLTTHFTEEWGQMGGI